MNAGKISCIRAAIVPFKMDVDEELFCTDNEYQKHVYHALVEEGLLTTEQLHAINDEVYIITMAALGLSREEAIAKMIRNEPEATRQKFFC